MDVPDTEENRQFFFGFKEVLKDRFQSGTGSASRNGAGTARADDEELEAKTPAQ